MLRRILIHGFKSFCDRTEIVFGTGVTAIVGPNGCGKSNLADALRWVLGEQNARLLRCNRLEELIFTGTQKRKAMGMAEVRLLIEGVAGQNEMEIMRRFTRDGSSEYRIDNKPSRYRDVYEALLGTGLSHTGYAVIGQGTIQELAGGKPEDRRVWIEEASGVSKYRVSQKSIEDKLQLAARDMVRLEDLLVELKARKTSLYSDCETASKYRGLTEQKERLELAMWLYQEREESRRVQAHSRRIERYGTEISGLSIDIQNLKADLPCAKDRLSKTEGSLRQLTNERETLATELLSLEKRRDSIRGQLSLVSRELESRNTRLMVLERAHQTMLKQEAELAAKSLNQSEEYGQAAKALEAAENERQIFEVSWKALGQKVIHVRAEVVSLTKELGTVRKAKELLRQDFEANKHELVEINSRIRSIEESLSRFRDNLERCNLELENALAAEKQASLAVDLLVQEAEKAKGSFEENQLLVQDLEKRLSQASARKRLLDEMEKSYEGYGKGPRSVLVSASKGALGGILGAVGDLFSCEQQYLQALSASVGGAAENVVVTDEESAKRAIEFLKRNRSGRCTFLPLTTLRPRGFNSAASRALAAVKGVKPLISVIEYPPSLKVCAEYLFGRVVLAETMNDGLVFMRHSSWAARVVTVGGENIDPGGSMTGGEASRHGAIFTRKQELKAVAEEIVQKRQELKDKHSALRASDNAYATFQKNLAEAKEEAFLLRSLVTNTRTRITDFERSIGLSEKTVGENQIRIHPLIAKEQELAARIGKLEAEETEISMQIAGKETELTQCEHEIKDYLSRDKGYAEATEGLRRKKEEIQNALEFVNRQAESLRIERLSTKNNLEEDLKELARLKSLKSEFTQEEVRMGQSILSLDGEMTALNDRIAAFEKQLRVLSGEFDQRFGEMNSKLKELTSLESMLSESKSELGLLNGSLLDTRRLISSRYGIKNPWEHDHLRISRQDALAQIAEIDSGMRSLGTVNLKAEQDYSELSDRIDSIYTEKNDVEEAVEELVKVKQLIEREIQNRFNETFNKVDENFQRIFKELFGGGTGKLNIVPDTLGIEVVAQPPGRRQKHFNLLSGGERSLCGIALIFAILSVRPSPVMVLDEVDSALDEANIVRFAQFLKRYSENTQFVVITHQESTMEAADVIYGITMEEPGVSKIFSMRLQSS